MRTKKTWMPIVLWLVVALALAACGGPAVEETATPEAAEGYVPVVSVTGEVVPEIWATASAQIGGTVIEVLVEPGSKVAAGDLLIRLDSTAAQLAIHQAEANTVQAPVLPGKAHGPYTVDRC